MQVKYGIIATKPVPAYVHPVTYTFSFVIFLGYKELDSQICSFIFYHTDHIAFVTFRGRKGAQFIYL
jgi:hypothetical protein